MLHYFKCTYAIKVHHNTFEFDFKALQNKLWTFDQKFYKTDQKLWELPIKY